MRLNRKSNKSKQIDLVVITAVTIDGCYNTHNCIPEEDKGKIIIRKIVSKVQNSIIDYFRRFPAANLIYYSAIINSAAEHYSTDKINQ